MSEPSSSGSSAWKWILGVIALLLLALVTFGIMASRKVARAMQENVQEIAVVRERIGTIRSMTVNAEATTKVSRVGVLVFDLTGSQGNGRLTIELDTTAKATRFFRGATLALPDGTTLPVVFDSAPPRP